MWLPREDANAGICAGSWGKVGRGSCNQPRRDRRALGATKTDPVDKAQHANGFKIKERRPDQTETEGSSSCC